MQFEDELDDDSVQKAGRVVCAMANLTACEVSTGSPASGRRLAASEVTVSSAGLTEEQKNVAVNATNNRTIVSQSMVDAGVPTLRSLEVWATVDSEREGDGKDTDSGVSVTIVILITCGSIVLILLLIVVGIILVGKAQKQHMVNRNNDRLSSAITPV